MVQLAFEKRVRNPRIQLAYLTDYLQESMVDSGQKLLMY
jgi:hypothetical protein